MLNNAKKKFILNIFYFLILLPIYKNNTNPNQPPKKELNMQIENKDFTKYTNCCGTIIIGSGPAGAICATYAARLGIPSTTIIMGEEPGGALMRTGTVENWPGILGLEGKNIMESTIKQAQLSGAQIIYEYVTDIVTDQWPFKVITNKNIYYAFSIMLATGSTINKLKCKGEEEYWGKGVSPCAICDAPLHKNKTVIIVGGGDSACEEALQLSVHASKVFVLVRSNKMRASFVMQERLKNDKKITILYNTELTEVIGNKKEVTDAILTNEEEVFSFSKKYPDESLSGVFIAIGQTPNIKLLENIVDILPNGLIKCKERSQKTSFNGIFCAGDVCNNYKQAVIAAGEGSKAAIEIFEFLQEKEINKNFYEKNKNIWLKATNTNCQNGTCTIENLKQTENTQITENTHKNKLKEITTEKEYNNLSQEHKNDLYIIEIFGSACPACDIMKKTLQQYIKENSLPTYLINIEKLPKISRIFSIKSIPVILLMKGSQIIAKTIGYMNLDELKKWIKKNTK
jgi:thioredoxin reductase (NADPH)